MATPALLLALSLAGGAPAAAQAPETPPMEPAAIQILDRMAEMIGSLHTTSFKVQIAEDVQDPDHGTLTRLVEHEVYMTGPDHMHVNTVDEKGHHGYWYNGMQVDYYNFTENNYGAMEAPNTIIATIDELNRDYGVEFPAADFFYPTFTDDLIAQSSSIRYLGRANVAGRECFRIIAHGAKQTVQLWIANDATFLPWRFIMTDHTRANARYEGTFSDWELNPDIPERLYDFEPPVGAAPIRIVSRNPDRNP